MKTSLSDTVVTVVEPRERPSSEPCNTTIPLLSNTTIPLLSDTADFLELKTEGLVDAETDDLLDAETDDLMDPKTADLMDAKTDDLVDAETDDTGEKVLPRDSKRRITDCMDRRCKFCPSYDPQYAIPGKPNVITQTPSIL